MPINVLDCGADPQGASPSDSAFAAALSALPAAGGRIYVPAGTYKLAATIHLSKPVILEGDGRYSTVLQWLDGVDGVSIDSPGGAFSVLCDLQLAGPGHYIWDSVNYQPPRPSMPVFPPDSPSAGTGNGVVMQARAIVERCAVSGWQYDGINIATGATLPNCNGWTVRDCRITNCGRHAILLYGTNANAGLAQGNDISECGGWGIWEHSFVGNTFVANQIAECRGGARWSFPGGVQRSLFLGEYSESDNPDSLGNLSLVVGGYGLGGCPLLLPDGGLVNLPVYGPVRRTIPTFVRGTTPPPTSWAITNISEPGLFIDASNGHTWGILPSLANGVGRDFVLKRLDGSAYLAYFTVLSGGTIDGNPDLTLPQVAGVGVVVHGEIDGYRIVGRF